MSKKVSIIIPVYNGQDYIDRCVSSVLRQTIISHENIEIILINDGSTDKSQEIIDSYSKIYPKLIRALSQENIGAAKTRNKGIESAKGDYAVFIDQDDFIEDDYIATLYGAVTSGGYDVLQCGYNLVNNNGSIVRAVRPINYEFGRFMAIPAWAKIHKVKFLRENDIKFFDNNIGEDSIFTTKEIICTEKYGTISYCGYNNSFDNQSNVTNNLHKGLSNKVDVRTWLKELAQFHSSNARMQTYLKYNLIRTAFYYLLMYGKRAPARRFYEVYRDIIRYLEGECGQMISVTSVLFAPRGEKLTVRIGMAGFTVIHKLRLVRLFAKIYCEG